MKKILMKAMMTSISEVMETMFFLAVEFGEESSLSKSGLNTENKLACKLKFTGDVSGSLIIVAPDNLAEEMAQNFMGETKETLTKEHLGGTLMEMANMVCGNALSKVDYKIPFELGIPELIDDKKLSDSETFIMVETPASKMAVTLDIEQ